MLIKKSESQNLKVGVLLPHSKQYPNAVSSFLNGVKLYFTLHENRFERGKAKLIIEDVGFGTERVSIEKTHKLITQDQAVMITGLLEPLIALEIGKMTELANVPTLLSGLGESAINPDNIPCNLYFNTLQYWQSCFLLGRYAAKNFDLPVSIITSFYDCGYDIVNAFRLGLLSGGGAIAEEIILKAQTPQELKVEVYQDVTFTDEHLPVALLHPRLLHAFIDTFGQEVKNMLVTPFYEGDNTTTKHWAFPDFSDHSIVSKSFREAVKEFFSTDANLFNLLGYQQGQLIYKALSNLSDPECDNETIINTWKGFREEMVTGTAYFSPYDHSLIHPVKLFKGTSRQRQSTIQSTQCGDFSLRDEIKPLHGLRNTYTNPYLFF